MATSSTSASSSSSASSVASLTAPLPFSGVSKFAGSLQQVLSRAVSIASLPLGIDQAKLTTLTTTQSDLQGLDTAFTGLSQAVASLQTTVSSNLLSASTSDSTVSARVSSGATAGTYTISVGNLGSYSTALSNAGATPVTDPTSQSISSSSTFSLSIGTTTTTITPASSSLQDLASAINSQSGGLVQATLVNVGSNSSPDYRLSLQSTSLTSDTIDLRDSSGSDLISTSTGGSPASYTIDGLPTPISSDSRTITLSPGLTVNLLSQSVSGASTTVTVSANASTLASAFSSFAGSYNAAVDALSQYHGQGGGALEGDSILQTLQGILNQLGTYQNGSAANSLANYGITLDQNGQLSVDSSTFTTAATANFPALLSVLGDATTGGFLGTATDLLFGVEDPTTGALKTEEANVANQVTAQNTVISNEQANINQIQTNLTSQISAADSTIASLESQVTFVTGLFAQYTGATNTQANGLATL